MFPLLCYEIFTIQLKKQATFVLNLCLDHIFGFVVYTSLCFFFVLSDDLFSLLPKSFFPQSDITMATVLGCAMRLSHFCCLVAFESIWLEFFWFHFSQCIWEVLCAYSLSIKAKKLICNIFKWKLEVMWENFFSNYFHLMIKQKAISIVIMNLMA